MSAADHGPTPFAAADGESWLLNAVGNVDVARFKPSGASRTFARHHSIPGPILWHAQCSGKEIERLLDT